MLLSMREKTELGNPTLFAFPICKYLVSARNISAPQKSDSHSFWNFICHCGVKLPARGAEMHRNKSIGAAALATAALLLLVMPLNGGPARAQTIEQVPALSEIVVTAQYREQGTQDTPISLAAISSARIVETGIRTPTDLQFLVPNFTLAETGISTNIFIRGIGSGVNQGFEQSVGYYIDGIHYPRAQQARMPFLDLERIEVLRGPQAILFGKNSVAGALNVSTAMPTSNFEAYVNTSYEFEYHEAIIEGAISGPISDRLRARVAARYRDTDGYVQNLTLDRSEPARKEWAVRATLGFDISDNLAGSFKAEFNNFDVSGRHIEIVNEKPVAAGPFTGLQYAQILAIAFGQDSSVLNNVQDNLRSATMDFSKNEQSSYVLELDWGLGGHELRSISAFTNLDYNELCDCDFTAAHIFLGGLQESYAQFSQEFRLTSPLWDQFDYVVGAYIQTSDHDFADQIMVPANSVLVPAINGLMPGAGSLISATEARRNASVEADFYSAFAQANVRPLDRLTLQIGGRITRELKDGFRTLTITGPDGSPLPALQAAAPIVYGSVFDVTSTNLSELGPPGEALIAGLGELPVRGTRNETRFSPDIKLLWQASDDALFYLSWATGFKSGGFDFRANNRGVSPTLANSFVFEDEKATNYELGTKVTLLEGSAELARLVSTRSMMIFKLRFSTGHWVTMSAMQRAPTFEELKWMGALRFQITSYYRAPLHLLISSLRISRMGSAILDKLRTSILMVMGPLSCATTRVIQINSCPMCRRIYL